MDAEQYCFEDFDYDEPEPSTTFDQSSDWDTSADVTLTEDRLKDAQAEETRTACKQLNHIKERQASIEKVTRDGIDETRSYMRLGSNGGSAFRSAKAAQRSSWAGSKSKAFFTHGRSRSWDFEDSGSGDAKGRKEHEVDNGFVRTGQGGTAKDAQAIKGILQNRTGAINQNQRSSNESNTKERADLETIGEQLLQEDKFSVRTRNDVHHVRWKANALSTKHIYRSQPHIYNGGPKLVHSASMDSSLPPNQSSPIRPAGLIDRKDRYQSTMHGELHSQRTTDSFGPVLQNRLPHQMKGQSLDNLPSAAERIRLFGPKDLIYDMNLQGAQLELSSRSSPLDLASSTDSGVSVSTTAESLESLEPEMARQLLLDIPPASLSPASSKLKRKPIVLPSDTPDALDKALGLPPSGRLWDTQTVSDKVLGLPPSGRQVILGDNLGLVELNELRARPSSCHSPNNGHRPVTRSLTAPPSTGTTEDGGKKILSKTGRSIVMAAPPIFSISSQGAAWRLEDEEEGYLPPTPSLEDTPFSQTSSQLYYPVPPRPTTPDTERVRTSASNGGLAKLARRLSQRGERRGEKLPCRQRSVSVDSDYESDVASANGIPDRLWSMLLVDDHHATMPRKPSTGDVRKAHSMESLVPGDDRSKSSSIPPSPLAPNKLQRSLSGKKRGASMNEVDSTGLGGSSVKDKGRRNSKYISDLQALFEAVEHQDLDVAKYCLEANGLDLNQPNPDEFTVLDIAVMTNNMPMSRLLLSHGARENPRFLLKDVRLNKLNTLINEAEQVIQDLTTRVVNGSGNNNATSSSSIKDADRQLVDWEWRYRLLKRMKTGFEQARVPDIPALVRLYTASSSSLLATFDEPLNMNGATATRFKIEWSQNEDFCPLAGEHILYHFSNLKYTIQGLTQGAKYYVRVSAFNMKGFGPAQTSNPSFAVPSCWRDVDGSKPRSWGRLSMIDELFQQVRDGRPADSVEIKSTSPRASPNQMRKTVRKSLKNLFQSAPKFQKHLRRGVYLASVIYNDDKVLVTTEDYLPIIEVDENFPSNVQQDFLWFMKVAQTWEDVDLLRTDLTQSTAASPVVHFRGRLLQAAAQLQSIMGMQDLGKLYYEPVKDSQGIVIFTLINCVKDPRTINNAALKWVSMTRVQKRKSMSVECPVAADLLLTSLPEKIIHHQVSSLPLTRGLYVGYLKLRSSLGNIRIQVPERHPSMLPHIKVRDNYNVSQEEWDWLHSLDKCEVKKKATRVQEDFQRQLASATRKLLTRVGVTEEEAITHRLCDLEVVELSSEVSFILLLPPLGSVCIGPGTPSDDWITSRDFTSISVPVFEMIHMSTYHGDFIRRYARLSSILDTESLITQQQLREAFSNDELNEAKRRQTQVEEFQKSLDMMWRGMRWIMDILQYARDKQIKGGVPLSVLYAPPPSPVDASEDILASFTQCMKDPQNHSLLPPPPCSSIGCQTMLLPVERAADNTLKSGILRVFPAYNSGLAKGTSVKLHVTSKTSCEDIVSLVVQQLNKAMESSGMETPAFSPEDCAHFCLVAIIANKEYTLQEDFCPLQLQNPWTKGQLFVRPKDSERAILNVGPSTAV